MGQITPTKVASYGLCIAGIALLVAGRIVDGLQGGFWAGIALLLIAASCLVDALLPGGSEMNPEYIAMIRQAGIPWRDGADKVASIVVGLLLGTGGLYLALA